MCVEAVDFQTEMGTIPDYFAQAYMCRQSTPVAFAALPRKVVREYSSIFFLIPETALRSQTLFCVVLMPCCRTSCIVRV